MNLKETLVSAWHLPDLRARILFVFIMFAVYAFGLHVPVPGLTAQQVEGIFNNPNNAIWLMIDMFAGGALRKVSILALGLNPYITASIIMQLMAVAIPKLQQLQKEGGEYGRKEINKYTRYLTIVLALLQGSGIASAFMQTAGVKITPISLGIIVICWTAGAMFLVWLGEQITEKGIGNGISLLIFGGIVAQLPYNVFQTIDRARAGAINPMQLLLLLAIFLGTIWAIVMFTKAQRRIPIQHARRIIGTRAVGGQTTYLPLSVNTAGVIPIIFAISILMLPQQIASMMPNIKWLQSVAIVFAPGPKMGWPMWAQPIPSIIYAGVIFMFTYFYTAVIYNVEDIADNLKKNGAMVPGIRPGKPTANYLDKVISRITAAGALFLSLIALMQYWVPTWTQVDTFTLVGGTSLLIVVGVALDTVQQIEAQLVMRQYEGFAK